jgi:hypothetical protein
LPSAVISDIISTCGRSFISVIATPGYGYIGWGI